MVTLEEAKNLSHGIVLLDTTDNNRRWRVYGEPKTWVKTPSKVQVPLKHGLYNHGYLTESNIQDFKFESEFDRKRIHEAIKHGASKLKKGVRVIYIKPKSKFAFGAVHKGDKGTITAKWHAGEVVVAWDKLKDKAGGTFVVPITEIKIIGKKR